ncbi:MAG: peptide chain release factor N(5)-glutamine methyltransferase [Pseudomonadota bacterium]
MLTIRSALARAVTQFAASESPKLDAETLLASALQKQRSHLFAWPDQALDSEQETLFNSMIKRRSDGEPVAHILGQREFWSMELHVTPDTLIPRPETELLVEHALSLIPTHSAYDVLDLGTGTGAIALAIASERRRASVTACDQSHAALEVAKMNADAHGLAHVTFIESNWFSALRDCKFDLIVCNPPYIKHGDPHLSRGDVKYEPESALISGEDGLDDIREIVAGASAHLKNEGEIAIEHGYDQGEPVREIFKQHGYGEVKTLTDLNGNERVCAARTSLR